MSLFRLSLDMTAEGEVTFRRTFHLGVCVPTLILLRTNEVDDTARERLDESHGNEEVARGANDRAGKWCLC